MTTEKMLEKVNEIIARVNGEDERKLIDFMESHPNEKIAPECLGAAGLLVVLRRDLVEQIKQEEAKRNGRGNARKTAEKIIKNYPNGSDEWGAWMEDDKQIITDAFRAVRLNSPIDLPEAAPARRLNAIGQIIKSAERLTGERLELPTIPELKAKIKIDKAANRDKKKYRPTYDFGDGLPMVDAEYLVDVLDLLGECTATAHGLKNTIYFSGEQGDGVLMPVHKR